MIKRKVLKLGQTAGGSKALEAVAETSNTSVNLYYQVTHAGKPVLQTPERENAQGKYDSLT